jgi:hypothetical protein
MIENDREETVGRRSLRDPVPPLCLRTGEVEKRPPQVKAHTAMINETCLSAGQSLPEIPLPVKLSNDHDLEQVGDAQLASFAELIYGRTGIRVSPQKKMLLSNRLRRRLRETQIASLSGELQDTPRFLGGERGVEGRGSVDIVKLQPQQGHAVRLSDSGIRRIGVGYWTGKCMYSGRGRTRIGETGFAGGPAGRLDPAQAGCL